MFRAAESTLYLHAHIAAFEIRERYGKSGYRLIKRGGLCACQILVESVNPSHPGVSQKTMPLGVSGPGPPRSAWPSLPIMPPHGPRARVIDESRSNPNCFRSSLSSPRGFSIKNPVWYHEPYGTSSPLPRPINNRKNSSLISASVQVCAALPSTAPWRPPYHRHHSSISANRDTFCNNSAVGSARISAAK